MKVAQADKEVISNLKSGTNSNTCVNKIYLKTVQKMSFTLHPLVQLQTPLAGSQVALFSQVHFD